VQFGGGYDSAVLDIWHASDGMTGTLSEDVTGRVPVVASIGAGAPGQSPFNVC
jgi:hypothetical protein